MNEQLAQLIDAYEVEMQQLQKQLTHCLWEGDIDYQNAYYCKNALQYTQEQLFRLKWLDDPHFYEKRCEMQWIADYQKRLADEDSEGMKHYYQQKIEKVQQKIERLNQLPEQPVSSSEVLLVDAIRKLMRKEIRNLKLILSKSNHFAIGFGYQLRTVRITLSGIKELITKELVGDYQMGFFKKLGFELVDHGNTLSITLKGNEAEIVSGVSKLIAIVIFDALSSYSSQFKNECYLQYQERS